MAFDTGGLPLRIFYNEHHDGKSGTRTLRQPLSLFARRGPKNPDVPMSEATKRSWEALEQHQGGKEANEVALRAADGPLRWTIRLPTHICFPRFVRTQGARSNSLDKIDERWTFSDDPNEVKLVLSEFLRCANPVPPIANLAID